jgi:hypothetical protein
MAYSLFKTPSKFISKIPRKDFIVLVVVVGITLLVISGVLIDKNKVEIAESFSNLTAEVANACESYPKIISGKVYGNANCDCPSGAGAAPKVPGEAVEIKENFRTCKRMPRIGGKTNVGKFDPKFSQTR